MSGDFTIPKEVSHVTDALREAGYEAYLVGGCVRDLFRDTKPKDWDVTTNATPEDIQNIFEHSFYENDFGTVGVVNDDTEDETLNVIEVTPYRIEGKYSDGRRPDAVHFSDKLEDDLKRRDFTINALAYDESKGQLIDLYKGQDDIKDKIVRTVGDPHERFAEDYLRMLRAVRIAAQLGFDVSRETHEAIVSHADQLENVSIERIRDEFSKLLETDSPMQGITVLHETGMLKHILPELEEGISMEQRGPHIYDVWEHNLRAVQHAADKEWPFHVRLAALLHDIAKPRTREWSDEQNLWTFHGHDVVGAKVSREILNRLKYPKDTIKVVSKMVRYHLFFSDPDQITLSAVRRLVRNIGKEYIWDLMKLRVCDRIGTGRPKEQPYRLRKFESMIEEAMRDPVTVSMLKIDGARIMEVTRENPGPRIGWILHALLEEVLEDPKRNTAEHLEERAVELANLADTELKELGEKGKEKQREEDEKELKEIRKKHWVK